MSVIHARLSSVSYDIHIQKGLLHTLGTQIAAWYKGNDIAVITDSTVDQLYGSTMENVLANAGYKIHKITIAPGEQSKSLINLNYVYNKLAEAEINRGNLIIAFGGGVVGDLAGFAAATYMRGIPYVQVPTTLMSQLDSSLGGKTAINLKVGKNLAGSFYHPKGVYIDPTLLETLTPRAYSDGLAEAVKYGAIKDAELFKEMLHAASLEEIKDNIEEIIFRCCSIKNTLVQKDEMDKGERQLLNFGHTIGHAIEKYHDYQKYTHGEAVSLGMLQITKNSEALKLTEKGSFEALEKLLAKCKLPTEMPQMDINQLSAIIAHDKKTVGNHMRFILLRSLGNSYIHQISKDDIKSFIV
ncbi:MAG: 3-dehydroquinate synthase [Clostridia bacterium]|jgi:3-dehydroquinate synthase|nr:3-dehydroquinate synthase [Clostridia bacterium]